MAKKSEADTRRAAHLLLTYFNNQMATRIVRRILRDHDDEAWKALTKTIIDLIPKAAEQQYWQAIINKVAALGTAHVESQHFKEKTEAFIKRVDDSWIQQAFDKAVNQRVVEKINALISNNQRLKEFHQDLPTYYKELVLKRVNDLAEDKAHEIYKRG